MQEIEQILEEVEPIIWPSESGKYGFIHAEIYGRLFLRFSESPDIKGHPLIALSIARELNIGVTKIIGLPSGKKGGGYTDIDVESREASFSGESGMFGKYKKESLAALLSAQEDYRYSFD